MKGKICIVDHDLGTRGFLRECLEKEGHSVVTFEHGQQVAPFLEEHAFDVFILSVDTPGVRERDLLVDLKRARQSRVLLVVSERGDAFLKEAIDLGVYGFIHKPFNPREICTMVTHLVR